MGHFKDFADVNNSDYDIKEAQSLFEELGKYESRFSELAAITPRDKETDRTECKGFVGTDKKEARDKESERRFCKCLYYTNADNAEIKKNCENCLMRDKQSEGYHAELTGNFKVIYYEFVPTDKGKQVGNVDLILADDSFAYLTEVKPATSSETLLRMFAEIETYYRVTVKGNQYKKVVGKKPLRKAIMFFKGSAQDEAFTKEDQAKYTKELIRMFGITVFRADIVENKVYIEAIA